MTLLATETFTAADGTLITARPCDTGQTWTKAPGSDVANMQIVGNKAQLTTLSTTAFTIYLLNVSLGSADYVLQATQKKNNAFNDSVRALFVRASGGNYYEFRRDGGSQEWYIARLAGGVETTLVTTAGLPSSGAFDVILTASVSGVGATVALSLRIQIPDEGIDTTISYNDVDATRIVATGLPGIGLFEPGTLGEAAWDDISVNGTAGVSGMSGAVLALLTEEDY